ncbi:MAG: ATP-dependent RecD-like DNA helicase [Candidatus Aureabacteria bacterium]|nr:ATP-dependent RecD-like DNA helicase [Candidatus Auribacterota bacterium]
MNNIPSSSMNFPFYSRSREKGKTAEETVLKGVVERIVYLNEETDYTVARINPVENGDPFTAVGHFSTVSEGENIEWRGEWIMDPRFGRQFKVFSYHIIYPTTEKGIIRFLSSGFIQGIGKKYAERIVKTFGIETIQIISGHPERLSEVSGLGDKRIARLISSWKEHFAVRDIMMFLQGYDISAAYAFRIYKMYGADAVEVVKANPYRLASEVQGIGFIYADKIARSMGIEPQSPFRIEAGLIYVLTQWMDSGHVYAPLSSLKKDAEKILQIGPEAVESGIKRLIDQNRISVQTTSQGESGIYLLPLLKAENSIVSHIKRILSVPSKLMISDKDTLLKKLEEESHITFSLCQRQALQTGMKEKMLVITGGPGTGKTTIIKTFVEIFKSQGLQFMLAAPTGRASKRLTEATGWGAKTIHRLLEYNPVFNQFAKNEDSPLEADAVIIDEFSMVDILLMYHLISAIPDHCLLIFVGDADQLPSVGPGTVLNDIIESRMIPTVKLNTIFRQAEGSGIILSAHRINQGEWFTPDLSVSYEDFFFIRKSEPEDIASAIEELVCERIPNRFHFDPFRDVQVITPMYKSLVGVHELNLRLQARLNPNEKIQVRRNFTLAAGDKVMQTVNQYDKEIFNGDLGFVERIDPENQRVFISFDGKPVEFSFKEMDEVVLAYAITVHKSQGSEYSAVVIPVTTQHYTMLQRNLLYTAITRGKKLVVLVGTDKALHIAIKNNHPQSRCSDLASRLRKEIE